MRKEHSNKPNKAGPRAQPCFFIEKAPRDSTGRQQPAKWSLGVKSNETQAGKFLT